VRLPLQAVFDGPAIEHLARRVDELGLALLELMSDEEAEPLLGAALGDSAL